MTHPSHAPYCTCPRCKPIQKPKGAAQLPPKCPNCWWSKAMKLAKCKDCNRPVEG